MVWRCLFQSLKLVLFTLNLSFRLDSRSFYLTLNTWRRFSYGIHIWLGGFFKFLWEFAWYPRLYHKVTTHIRQWEACGLSPSHDASRFSSPPIHWTCIQIVSRDIWWDVRLVSAHAIMLQFYPYQICLGLRAWEQAPWPSFHSSPGCPYRRFVPATECPHRLRDQRLN